MMDTALQTQARSIIIATHHLSGETRIVNAVINGEVQFRVKRSDKRVEIISIYEDKDYPYYIRCIPKDAECVNALSLTSLPWIEQLAMVAE